jgi:hypothetical protein
MHKTISLLTLLFLIGSTAQAQRSRIVNLPSAPQVTLNGQVTEIGTGQPVTDVEVSGQGRFTRTNAEGKFTMQVSQGLPVTLTFARSGFTSKTETFTPAGPVNRTFQLQPLPTARFVTKAGVTHTVDADTVEFGYAIPFSGIRRDKKAEMCTPGGQKFTLERENLARIEGPQVTTTDAACCTRGPVNGALFQMKNGERITAYFLDSCEHPHIQLIARDHRTWQMVFVELSDLQEAVIP